MTTRREEYVQGSLFAAPRQVAVGGRRKVRRRPDSRETRDPAVAAAYEAGHRLHSGIKMGLAAIIGSRSEEERAAIRALFERPRVA